MPRLKSIIFYQNSSKIKLLLQKKMQNFRLGAPPPDPQNSPLLRISGYMHSHICKRLNVV